MNKKILNNILKSFIKKLSSLYFKINKKTTLSYIPPSGKVLDEKELENMLEACFDMWLTAGRFNDEFEQKFADFLGVKYCLTTNSGSSANLLAISALTSPKLKERALKKGDEVITVASGFPTTVNPIIQNGMIPVFLDCEIGSYNIDSEQIEKTITSKTKAIFLAHTLGMPFDLEKISQICKKYNLWLIEDACDALGATYNNQKIGTFGDIATFSFYPAHHITMGEGGAVATSNTILNKVLLSFRDWGRDCWCKPGVDDTCKHRFKMQLGKLPFGYDHKYTYSHLGYNLKITDYQAAIGVAQLKKLPYFLNKRRENAEYLFNKLIDLKDYLILPTKFENVQSSWFGFLISVKENAPFSKQQLVEFLEQNGIGTRQLFAGNILRQPSFVEQDISLKILNSDILLSSQLQEEHFKMLPNTEFVMNSTFWVGCYPALGYSEMDKISATIHDFVRKYR